MATKLKPVDVVVVGVVVSIAAIACYGAEDGHWSYSGATGPTKWGSLEKSFTQCKLGQNQSPIDIPDANARKAKLRFAIPEVAPRHCAIVS